MVAKASHEGYPRFDAIMLATQQHSQFADTGSQNSFAMDRFQELAGLLEGLIDDCINNGESRGKASNRELQD